jgi:hypothetical protein
VAQHWTSEFSFAAIRLKLNDILKVGRVRFKVREIVSRVYNIENERQSRVSELYYSMYPEYEPSSMGNTDHED